MSATATKKAGFGSVLWDYLTTVDHKKDCHIVLDWRILFLHSRWFRSYVGPDPTDTTR